MGGVRSDGLIAADVRSVTGSFEFHGKTSLNLRFPMKPAKMCTQAAGARKAAGSPPYIYLQVSVIFVGRSVRRQGRAVPAAGRGAAWRQGMHLLESIEMTASGGQFGRRWMSLF